MSWVVSFPRICCRQPEIGKSPEGSSTLSLLIWWNERLAFRSWFFKPFFIELFLGISLWSVAKTLCPPMQGAWVQLVSGIQILHMPQVK